MCLNKDVQSQQEEVHMRTHTEAAAAHERDRSPTFCPHQLLRLWRWQNQPLRGLLLVFLLPGQHAAPVVGGCGISRRLWGLRGRYY